MLEAFLARPEETQGEVLKDKNTQAHQQITIKAFFNPITPTHADATSQSRGDNRSGNSNLSCM